MMEKRQKGLMGRFCAALVLIVLTSGCASLSNPSAGLDPEVTGNQWVQADDRITYFSEHQSRQLSRASSGKVLSFDQTPFGKNTSFVLKPRYFSAAGIPCFSTIVRADGAAPFMGNVCKFGDTLWGVTKSISETKRQDAVVSVGGSE